jgi:hypothetical protein
VGDNVIFGLEIATSAFGLLAKTAVRVSLPLWGKVRMGGFKLQKLL